MRNPSSKILMFLTFVLFVPCYSYGWKAITNPPSTWRSLPVPYWVNNDGCRDIGGFDAAVNVAEISFDTWENNDCTSWQVSYQGGTPNQPYNQGDGKNVLGWTESGWPFEPYAIGVTQNMMGGGTIWSSDIAFNAVNFTWSLTGGGGYTVDAQSIVTHEEGHFLGLDHPPCTMQQTMCASYSGGTAERTLTSDDIDGVCSLYPGTGPPPECTTDAECDDKFQCVDGKCVGGICAPCSSHENCGGDNDYCLTGFPDGNLYCGMNCTSDTDCGAGNKCFDLGGGIKQCLPETLDCSGSAVQCTTDEQCPSGYTCQDGSCVPVSPPECTDDSQCMTGYVCQDGRCVPDTSAHLPICSECTSDDECGYDNDLCITTYPDGTTFPDGKSYCGRWCESGDCGAGYECFTFSDKPAQCLPSDHVCRKCNPIDLSGCDEGYYCDFQSCSVGVCRPGYPGTVKVGAICGSDLDCESLQCIPQITGSYCSATCIPTGAEICPYPLTCQPLEYGACGYCSCDSGRMGDVCKDDSTCQSGGCLTLPDGSAKVCSMYCGGVIGCPANFDCQLSPDGFMGCFPIIKKPGDPCDREIESCLGGWCDTELGYCTRQCDENCRCPVNMHCDEEKNKCVEGAEKNYKSGCGCEVIGSKENGGEEAPFFILAIFVALVVFRKKPCIRRKF